MTSLVLLFKYLLIMEIRFDAMLYSNKNNENSDAGHIKCSCGPQVLHPWSSGMGLGLDEVGQKGLAMSLTK